MGTTMVGDPHFEESRDYISERHPDTRQFPWRAAGCTACGPLARGIQRRLFPQPQGCNATHSRLLEIQL